jgi:two-component system CheB/CheR fusion protein
MQLLTMPPPILPVAPAACPMPDSRRDLVRQCRVVIIDDDSSIRQAFTWAFQDLECEVIASSGSADALAQMMRLKFVPDAVIADYHIDNETSGLRAIRLIRRLFRLDLPAVIITGDISISAAELVRPDEGIRWLFKPVGYTDLSSLVDGFRALKERMPPTAEI